MKQFLAITLVGLVASQAAASITVDGSLDASYGAALAVQEVQTQFGDANPNNGSELDAAYGKIWNNRLYLMFTGNLEQNFNKLEVFIDSMAGGEQTLSATPAYDFFNGSTWISSNLQGLTFDNGFAADYHLIARGGGNPGDGNFEIDFVNRSGGGVAMVPGSTGSAARTAGLATGAVLAGSVGPNASGTALGSNLDFSINNTNTAGVTGGTAASNQAAALAVTTGIEVSIALSDIGYTGGPLLVAAMVNNGDHNYLSNQVLGSLQAPQGNLGANGSGGGGANLSLIDFRQFAGTQYFRVPESTEVPEPAAMVMAVLAATGLVALRRRNG